MIVIPKKLTMLLETIRNHLREHKNTSCEGVVLALHPLASGTVTVAYNMEFFATLKANTGVKIFGRIDLVAKQYMLG
ncbi:MAG TPA: hypothetical protein VER14_04945 [Phototrophicaceae bacterium]|nr:hypothetical protein [Phototrophicaceae bacterium]